MRRTQEQAKAAPMTARSSLRRMQPPPAGVAPSSARASVRSGGYPILNSKQALQEAKMQLEQLRKETLEIRAAEAQLKLGIKREEEKVRNDERRKVHTVACAIDVDEDRRTEDAKFNVK